MKLEVRVASEAEFPEAESFADLEKNVQVYKSFVLDKMAEAGDAGLDKICFQSIEMSERPSDNFMRVGWILQAVNEYQLGHEMPEKVCIACKDLAAAAQYKVVYNFYYADSKANRLDDDRWD